MAARNPQRAISQIRNPDTYGTLSRRHKRIVTDIVRALLHASITPVLVYFIAAQVHFYLLALSSGTKPLGFMRWWRVGSAIGFVGICLLLVWWLPRYIQRLAEAEDTASVDG